MQIGNLELFNLIQGTDEWHEFRKHHYPASEAPVVMGAGMFEAKNAHDLAEHRLGIRKFVLTQFKEQLFEKGHEMEASARPIVESMIGERLSPVVGKRIVDGLPLSASSDGLSFNKVTNFEHKMWSQKVVASIDARKLEPGHYWQLEQQNLVFGCKRNVFVCSDGTMNNFKFLIYESVPGRAEQLVKGWKEYEKIVAGLQQEDPDWVALVEPVKEVKAKIAELQEQIKSLNSQINMEQLIEFAEKKGVERLVGSGVCLKRTKTKGAVDYESLSMRGINLDDYRKPSSPKWELEMV